MPHHRETHPEHVDGCYNCKLMGIKFNGMVSLKTMREAGTSGKEMAKENIEAFRKNNNGKDPVSATERWI